MKTHKERDGDLTVSKWGVVAVWSVWMNAGSDVAMCRMAQRWRPAC